jgi:hypothetical protein
MLKIITYLADLFRLIFSLSISLTIIKGVFLTQKLSYHNSKIKRIIILLEMY